MITFIVIFLSQQCQNHLKVARMDSQKPGGSTLGLVEQYLGVINCYKDSDQCNHCNDLDHCQALMIVINIIVIFIDIVTKNTLE